MGFCLGQSPGQSPVVFLFRRELSPPCLSVSAFTSPGNLLQTLDNGVKIVYNKYNTAIFGFV